MEYTKPTEPKWRPALDEYEDADLANELKRRRKARAEGLCDFCLRPTGTKPVCLAVFRHTLAGGLQLIRTGPQKEVKPPVVPKGVREKRVQLALVIGALAKARDATAELLASEAGLKPHNLAKLLDQAAQGWCVVRDGGQRYPLPEVGVRLERDYLTGGGWTVAVVS